MSTRYFIRFTPDVAGPVTVAGYEKWLELDSLSFGVNDEGPAGSIDTVGFSIALLPGLAAFDQVVASGSRFAGVTIQIVDDTDGVVTRSIIKLGDTWLTGHATLAGSGGFQQNFTAETAKITWSVVPFDAGGDPLAPEKVSLAPFAEPAPSLPSYVAGDPQPAGELGGLQDGLGGLEDKVRYYMRLAGNGESQWVEIDGFDYTLLNETHLGAPDSGSGSGSGRVEFSQLAVSRAADDASLLFSRLQLLGTTEGDVQIVVVRDIGVGTSNGAPDPHWEVVANYRFGYEADAQHDEPLVDNVRQGGITPDGLLREDITFNFTTLYREARAPTGNVDVHGNLQLAEKSNVFGWSLNENKTFTASVLPPPGIDSHDGDLTGVPVPVEQAFADVKFFLGIEALEGGDEIHGVSAVPGHATDFELYTYSIDVEARQLTIVLPEIGDISSFTQAIARQTFAGDLTLVAEGILEGGGQVELGRIEISRAQLDAVANSFAGDFLDGGGAATRTLTFSFDAALGTDSMLTWKMDTPASDDPATLTYDEGGTSLTDIVPGGGRSLPGDNQPIFSGNQRAFMRVTPDGSADGTEWVEIDNFNFGLDDESGYSTTTETISIGRVVDDATAKLAQLLTTDTHFTVEIEVWQGFDTAGGEAWAGVGDYRLESADLIGQQQDGMGGGFAIEALTFAVAQYSEHVIRREDFQPNGLPDPEDVTKFGFDFTTGTDTTDSTPETPKWDAPVDTQTGVLERPELSDPSNPVVNYSNGGGSGLRLFLFVDNIDSGDPELGVMYDEFDDWFSVNGYSFGGSAVDGSVTFGGLSVVVANTNNVALLNHVADAAGDGEHDPRLMRLVAVDAGPFGNADAGGQIVWEISSTDATISIEGLVGGRDRTYEIDLGDSFVLRTLASPDGQRHATPTYVEGLFTKAGDHYVATGDLAADDSPASVQNGFGGAWASQLAEGGGQTELRYVMNMGGNGDPWKEVGDFSIDFERKTLTFTRFVDDDSIYEAYLAATGELLAHPLALEVWAAGDKYRGLADYVFEGAAIVSHRFDAAGEKATEHVTVSFENYQELVAQYDGLGNLRVAETKEQVYASDGTVSLTMFGYGPGNNDPFDGVKNPIEVLRGAPLTAGEEGTGVLAAALVTEFADIAAAIQFAEPGDTIFVTDTFAIGLNSVLVNKDNLTIDLNAGVSGIFTLAPGITALTFTGSGSVTVTGATGDSTITAGGGNDRLTDGIPGNSEGVDHLAGGAGDDWIVVTFASQGESYDGGTGNDTLDMSLDPGPWSGVQLGGTYSEYGAIFESFENYVGSTGSDNVTGSNERNIIMTGFSADAVSAQGGDDEIDGGAGNDQLFGDAGDDTITDQDGENGIDTIAGGADDDTIIVTGAVAGETFDGGADVDTLDLSQETKAYSGGNAIDLAAPGGFVAHGATFADFENVIGTAQGDSVTGSVAENMLLGGGGADYLDGGGGEDILDGGAGDDEVHGGNEADTITDGFAGNGDGTDQISGEGGADILKLFVAGTGDVYDGGEGIDTIDISGAAIGLYVDLGQQFFGDIELTENGALLADFENIIGSDHGDVLADSAGSNVIDAGAGDDYVVGGLGTDDFDGGAGSHDMISYFLFTTTPSVTINLAAGTVTGVGIDTSISGFEDARGAGQGDTLIGTDGANLLYGERGDDRLVATLGNDHLDGGDGMDAAEYELARADITKTLQQDGSFLVGKGLGQTDTLVDVETLKLTDGSWVLGLDSPNADFTYRMYTAAYFRTPDEGGFRYWTDRMDQPDLGGDGNLSYQDKLVLANQFLIADEFQQVYGGPNPTNEHYVELMYENVLKREFDQEGRDYWLGRMEEGAGRDEILTVFVDSLENLANTVADRTDGFWVV